MIIGSAIIYFLCIRICAVIALCINVLSAGGGLFISRLPFKRRASNNAVANVLYANLLFVKSLEDASKDVSSRWKDAASADAVVVRNARCISGIVREKKYFRHFLLSYRVTIEPILSEIRRADS